MKKCLQWAVAVLALLLSGVGGAKASPILVVSPNGSSAVEGNAQNGFPFDTSNQRYQQVYAANDFTGVTGPHELTQIAFRPDALSGQAFASVLPDIQIDLSTTVTGPDGLSSNFAANVGTDDTVVFGPGPLSLSSSFTGPAGGPKDFDIIIPLTTPFLYDPAKGNLLLDVRTITGATTTPFDAVNVSGDGVSRAYATPVGSQTGSRDTLGLVTQFTFADTVSPAPEPGSLVLLGTGAVCLLGWAWRRRSGVAGSACPSAEPVGGVDYPPGL